LAVSFKGLIFIAVSAEEVACWIRYKTCKTSSQGHFKVQVSLLLSFDGQDKVTSSIIGSCATF